MQNNENPQENEKANALFDHLKLVIEHYELMKNQYAEIKNDLSIALKENDRLKKELKTKPAAKFQFNVN